VPLAVAKPAMDAVRTLMIFEMDGMEIREVCFWMQSTYFIKYYIMEYVSRKNLQECHFLFWSGISRFPGIRNQAL